MNLCISGALGRMGRMVYAHAKDNDILTVTCGVDAFADKSDLPYPVYTDFTKVTEKIDVIIDFSSKNALDGILDYALKTKTALVLCATGYESADIEKIENASKQIAIFRSANMSIGVNVLINLVKKACLALPYCDIEIIEKHHNQKVDSPSGTAVMIADGIKEVMNEKYFTYGRQGMVGKRDKNEVGIHAIRGGSIVGEHQVIFAGPSETITLTHEAGDRGLFATGALNAAAYIVKKENGLFNMQDMLGEL